VNRLPALLLAVALGCAVIGAPAADFEQVQRIKNENAIPNWREAAAQAKAQHDQAPDEATLAIWQALDKQTDPETGKAPLQQVIDARDADQLFAYASWLRWRILSEKADARYSFAYAYNLSHMRDKSGDFGQEAVIFYLHAKLALALDGNRCSDRSKADHLMAWYPAQPNLQPLVAKIDRMSAHDKSIAMLEAISLEEMLGERPPMRWLCPSPDAMDAVPSDAEVDLRGSTPRFTRDDRWRKYRSYLLEQLTRIAMRDLQLP
jgi:rRNA maturation protein Nop10